jgi:hypothetical protein
MAWFLRLYAKVLYGGYTELSPFYKKLVLWLVIGLMLITIFEGLEKSPRSRESISYKARGS